MCWPEDRNCSPGPLYPRRRPMVPHPHPTAARGPVLVPLMINSIVISLLAIPCTGLSGSNKCSSNKRSGKGPWLPYLLLPSFHLALLIPLIYSLLLHQPLFKNTAMALSVLAAGGPHKGKTHPLGQVVQGQRGLQTSLCFPFLGFS